MRSSPRSSSRRAAGRGGQLPASLHEVLAARLAALDEVTQGIVRVAAVAGRVVSHELLEQVAGTPSPVLIAALREAVDHGVLLRRRRSLARLRVQARARPRGRIRRAPRDRAGRDPSRHRRRPRARRGVVAGRRAGPDGRDRLPRVGCQRPVTGAHGVARRRGSRRGGIGLRGSRAASGSDPRHLAAGPRRRIAGGHGSRRPLGA